MAKHIHLIDGETTGPDKQLPGGVHTHDFKGTATSASKSGVPHTHLVPGRGRTGDSIPVTKGRG